jgi:oligosaccharide repeat unit polymerase
MATLVATLFLILALAFTRKVCRGVTFNPLIAFFGIWLVALALFELDRIFGFFYVRLSDYAISLLVLSFVLVFVGGVLGVNLARNAVRDNVFDAQRQARGLTALTFIYVGIAILATLWRYHIVVVNYGSLFRNLASVRHDAFTGALTYPLISRAMSLFGYVAIANLGVLLATRWNPAWLALSVLVVFADFINDTTVGMRGSTFNAVLLLVTTILVTLTVKRGRMDFRHLLAAGGVVLAGVCLITVILYLRSGFFVGLPNYWERLFKDNYVYLVGTIPSLSVFLNRPWPTVVGGQYTFLPLFEGLDWVGRHALGVPIFPATVGTYYAPITKLGPFNASSYLAYFYSDFRLPGVIVLSFLMGYASSYAFMKAFRSKRVLDIQIASLLTFMMIFTVRGIATSGTAFWATLVLLIVQHFVLEMRWRGHHLQAQIAADARR